MDRMDTSTPDIERENVDRLCELFPSVATEVVGDDGVTHRAVDLDALRELVGDAAEGARERYQFTWPGKREAKAEAYRPIDKTMRPEKEKSVDWDATRNLYIEGDNLEALKLLRNTYAGKVKLIYIDPPYNTGHDFVYDDDFARTRAEYDAASGDYDEEGGRLVENPESNGRFHSDWCSMMYPRLLLARDLLSSDGFLFVSIDDSELCNCRKMLEEVFGSSSFLGTIVRSTGQTTGQDSGGLGSSFDYLLCFTKTPGTELHGLPLTQHDLKRFDSTDEKGRYALDQMRKTGSNDRREDRPNMYFAVIDPDGNEVYPTGPSGYESCWRFEKKTYEKLVADGMIVWKKTIRHDGETWWPYVKYYAEGRTKRPSPLWNDIDGNKKAARDLRALFDGQKVFDFPKPVELIKRIITIAGVGDGDIVLDFFSGSATTADALMQFDEETGHGTSFILTQISEICDKDRPAFKAGYDTICDIGEERIRRAGAKVRAEVEESNRQLKIGEEPRRVPDVGFRVLRIDSSNFADTHATPQDYEQGRLSLFRDNLKGDRSGLDLLFQVLPAFRIPYSATIKRIDVGDRQAFDVNDGQLVACFDADVSTECIEAIARMRPLYAVLRDASLADDATAANFEELFKTYSPDTVRRVI